ncbi:hypothetical protein CUZ56_01355 [Saezia sanguinis]|uniref:TIGR03752 family integrating conjugative element protein n=1 Tax=Saezia sanguinis TaxID=1965230 RepID=A0A433SFB1_9BURK|nr:TIGR03752 family integrating conjugative element protein [Saezia sanguinis]RUS67410.1 hypothetical protein CUZ56_01355 [Saezia sanguinis]
MKSNGLLKWLLIPAVLIVLVIGLKVLNGDKNHQSNDDAPELTADEMKALGIEGDTPRDTVATLVGQVKQLRLELKTAMDENKTQRTENERLRQRERDVDQRIRNALNDERETMRRERQQNAEDKRETQNILSTLQQRIEGLGNDMANNKPAVELPIGLGLEGPADRLKDEIIWIEPSDAQVVDPRANNKPNISFPSSFSTVDASGKSLHAGERIRHESYSDHENVAEPTPVYTVPANSTLTGSVAMTALIGRVPVDSTVNDPYPFKVLIGPDNLTANGIELPDVAGAVLSGTATGDWTLSCVRGQITSMTFVFNDGTIRTVPANTSNNNGGNNRNNTNALGWISDPHGIPCVSGERRSNATQYLTSQALITAAGAGAASLIKNEGGNISYANSDGSIGSVGITGNEAMGRILTNGVQDMSAWVNKLYGQAFAAIYVQPGAHVAVHIEREISVDYDTNGRKVNHTTGSSYENDLD